MLQVRTPDASPLVVVSVAPVAIVAVKLHVPDHALQLALDRAPEVVLGLVIILVQELVVVVVMGAQVVQENAKDAVAVLETVDPVVMVVVVVLVMGAKSHAHLAVEQTAADSAEIAVSSVIVNGGLICMMYM